MHANKKMTPPVLFLVLPCYNESEILPLTISTITGKLQSLISRSAISEKSKAVFVDDGSIDDTWTQIEKAVNSHVLCAGIKLAHNSGHQKALFAGMMVSLEYADIVISIDSDLQQDINALDDFLQKHEKGAEIVYGIRKKRVGENRMKRFLSKIYYRMLQRMGVNIIAESADYRLLSKRALQALSQYKEKNLFLRGLIPSLGLKSDVVYYEQFERTAGISKYPFKKMLSFAWDGVTSFSSKPFHLMIGTGLIFLVLSILAFIVMIFLSLFGVSVQLPFYISFLLVGLFGLAYLFIGIVGEYLSKVLVEVKDRPLYLIEEECGFRDI